MKREILFRGKTRDSGRWITGNLINLSSDNYAIRFKVNDIYFDVEVIPKTIGQFTGLKDKNRKKIFEGDIIKYTEHSRYLLKSFIAAVSYKEYLASFAYLKLGLDENGWEQPLIHFFNEIDEFEEDVLPYIEIIGNIHDNQELLK